MTIFPSKFFTLLTNNDEDYEGVRIFLSTRTSYKVNTRLSEAKLGNPAKRVQRTFKGSSFAFRITQGLRGLIQLTLYHLRGWEDDEAEEEEGEEERI